MFENWRKKSHNVHFRFFPGAKKLKALDLPETQRVFYQHSHTLDEWMTDDIHSEGFSVYLALEGRG